MREFFPVLALLLVPAFTAAAPDPYAEPAGPGESTPATEKEVAEARAEYRKNHFDLTTGYRLAKALYWAGRYADARAVISDTSTRPGKEKHEMQEFESVFYPVSAEEKKFHDASAALTDPKAAEAALKKFVTEHPGELAEYLAYGFTLWQTGRKPEAEAMVTATLAKDPQNAGAVTLQGALRLDEKKFDEAIPILKKAVQLDHANAYAFQKLSSLLVNERPAGAGALPYLAGHIILSPGEAFPWAGRQEERLEREREKALLGDKPTPDHARRLLASPDGHLRRLGCRFAAGAPDASLVDLLVELLDDDSDSLRSHAAGALIQIGAKHPAEVLKGKDKVLASGKPFAESAVLSVIAALQPEKEAVPLLVARLQHANSTVRYEAAGLLVEQRFRKNPEAKAALAKFYAEEKDTAMVKLRKEATSRVRFERNHRASNSAYFLSSKVQDVYDTPKPLDKPYYKLAAEAEKKLAAKDYAGAEKAYVGALDADPQEELFLGKERVLAYLGLAKIYIEAGKLDEAEMLLEIAQILGKDPERAEAHFLHACLHDELDEKDDTERELKRALEIAQARPELRAGYVARARTEARLAKFRATPAFEKALTFVSPKSEEKK